MSEKQKKPPADTSLTEGQAQETRNDAGQARGFFAFSGELCPDGPTRTDLFPGDLRDLTPLPPADETATSPEPPPAPQEETDLAPRLDPAPEPPEPPAPPEPPPSAADADTDTAPRIAYAEETDTAPAPARGEPVLRFAEDPLLETRAFETPTLTDFAPSFPRRHDETVTHDVPAHAAITQTQDKPAPEATAADPEPAPPRRGRRRERPQEKSLLARIGAALRRPLALPRWRPKFSWRGAAEGTWSVVRAVIKPPKPEIEPNHNAEWWRRTLTEIAALFAIVVPIEIALTGGRVGSFGVHPHPYWIIVLPMAGARGVVAGLVAAAVGSLLYAVGAWRAARPEEAIDLFTFRTMLEPILFFGVGYFVGELHDELALRYRKLQRLVDDVQARNTGLRQERDVLAEANRQLERRIVDDSTQFGNLILAARRIEQAGQREVFEVALDLVEEHCGASASVLLLLDDRSLDYLCHRGWKEGETAARLAAARRSRFVERVVAEGVAVNGLSPEETVPDEGPLVVAPLFDASGMVKALLCLDDLPASRLNESTVTTFLGIGEWISAALARIARGRDAPDPRRAEFSAGPEADAWLGTPDHLGRRLRLELERCARYGVPASFLVVHARDWTDTTREGVANLDRYVLTHFTTGLRPSDALYRFGYPGCYLLVLAGTTVEGAEVVRTRLLRRVEYAPRRDIGALDIFATGPDAGAPDLASLIQRVAARLRKLSSLPLEGHCPVAVPQADELGGIDDFIHRIKMEASLAARNGFDLHVVGISAEAGATPADGLLARHVRDVGARLLRPTDGVYAIGPFHSAVVLPCTPPEEAAAVAHRLVTAVRARDPDAAYGDLQTQVMGLGASHPDAGSFLEALAKRGASGAPA